MKLSVLLPTRNGAHFLPGCLDAVFDQTDASIELVVSDNANEDGTREILRKYSRPNLTVVRQDSILSVTDNWTAALDAATGDYLWMVGDDDLVLPGAASWLMMQLESYGWPDCLSFGAYSYIAPGGLSGGAPAYWAPDHFRYGEAVSSGERLSESTRKRLVVDLFRFRAGLPLNMQLTVFSKEAVSKAKAPFFRAPFPDHYALASMLLTAGPWFYSDYRPLVVGVSPKSFGHYFYSGQGAAGLGYLGSDYPLPRDALPGNELLSLMYAWLVLLDEVYPDELHDFHISRGDYVARQVWSWLVDLRLGRIGNAEILNRLGLIRLVDLWEMGRLVGSGDFWMLAGRRLSRLVGSRAGATVSLQWAGLSPIEHAQTISEFARLVTSGGLARP